MYFFGLAWFGLVSENLFPKIPGKAQDTLAISLCSDCISNDDTERVEDRAQVRIEITP